MFLQITEPSRNIVQEKLAQAVAIGIDLGTTNSVVAFSEDQKSRALPDANGDVLLPSVVAYLEGKTPLVGASAFDLINEAPDCVVTSSKRMMSYSKKVKVVIRDTFKTPIEVAGHILAALKAQAETALNQPIEKAVITVPAYFDEAARQATKDAAALVGLQVLRLLNEPTAAALAYGLDQGVEGIYAIYDLGGGTFDLSLLRLTKGVFQVLATGGDIALGGDDIDQLIMEYFYHLNPDQKIKPKTYKQALNIARKAKEYLSQHDQGLWTLPEGGDCPLDRDMLDRLTAPLVERTIDICRQVLIDADLMPQDIKGVVLVGGVTRMPVVRGRVEEFFGKAPLTNLDPDLVVAMGAALQAEALTHGSETLLLDVTPLSLGLETMGGIVEKIIPRNTPIPATVTQEFTTWQDGQTLMKIHVVQGERELVSDCRSLGEFTLQGIPPLTAGAARIAVTFMVDADGLLTVKALEKTTNTHQEITVKPSYGLSEEEMHRILVENTQHGEKDIKSRLLVEARVKAEQLLHHLGYALKVDGDLLADLERHNLVVAMEGLEKCLTGADQDAIVEQRKMLESLSTPFAERRIQRLMDK